MTKDEWYKQLFERLENSRFRSRFHLKQKDIDYIHENANNAEFILESTYIRLRNMSVVLCRICDEKSYLKNSCINGMRLAQESILMQFGYTVSQEEGLSASRRQKILAVMIDNKVLSKSEIISYLDFFISQRHYQSKFELAISKWEMDREFVRGYRAGEYTQFGVNAIYRRR